LRHWLLVELHGYDAQRVEPTLISGRSLEAHSPTDRLPWRAVGAHPDDPAINWIEANGPSERFFHPRNGRWRRRWQRCLSRFLANEVAELVRVVGPGVEVAPDLLAWQSPQNGSRFGKARLDQLWRPDRIRSRIGPIAIGAIKTAVH